MAHIPGLIILDKRDRERFQIAISAPEHGCKPVHQRGGRRIGNEVLRKLGGDVACGARVSREVGKGRFALLDTGRLVELAEQGPVAGLVRPGKKAKTPGSPARPCAPENVQPVRICASDVTSAWV